MNLTGVGNETGFRMKARNRSLKFSYIPVDFIFIPGIIRVVKAAKASFLPSREECPIAVFFTDKKEK